MFPTRTSQWTVVVLFSGMLLLREDAYSQSKLLAANLDLVRPECGAEAEIIRCVQDPRDPLTAPGGEDDIRVATELSTLGQRGGVIAHAREQALEILEARNSCAAWFEEGDPDPAGIFRSLHYKLDDEGASEIYRVPDDHGAMVFKHPWGATAAENAGRNALVVINTHGPFFTRKSQVRKFDSMGLLASFGGWDPILIGPYVGDTAEARITILLHELGHILGMLPDDNDPWSGQSSRNTAEVLRHCKREIHQITRREAN